MCTNVNLDYEKKEDGTVIYETSFKGGFCLYYCGSSFKELALDGTVKVNLGCRNEVVKWAIAAIGVAVVAAALAVVFFLF
mmetsp:Transcript_39030/g.59452  ORF Transcript_39030/g.59452 Transcript_39030/m.59452 type:complete len:80 (+) Transcript_39030:158-397(+)